MPTKKVGVTKKKLGMQDLTRLRTKLRGKEREISSKEKVQNASSHRVNELEELISQTKQELREERKRYNQLDEELMTLRVEAGNIFRESEKLFHALFGE